MASKHPHEPERFQVFTELPDGSGFKIKGSPFIFKFDRFGGWFDQYANYYNSQGIPDDAPSDSDDSHSVGQPVIKDESASEEDEFQRQFGKPKHYEEDEEPEDIYIQKIARNLQILNSYPSGHPFRVNFRNMAYISKRNEAYVYFKNKVPGILNVVFLQNQRKQFNGNGYFVVEDVKSGQNLIKLEGEKYNQRELSFVLEDVQEVLHDPIQPDQLYPNFLGKQTTKNYINKGGKFEHLQEKPQPIKQKVFKTQAKREEKPDIKEHIKKEEVKKDEQGQLFSSYVFEKNVFPKKSSFKEWVQQNHFNHEKDIQLVEKIESDVTKAKVTMKRKVFNALNGKQYLGVKIIFNPIQK